jgi:hypothetical protein
MQATKLIRPQPRASAHLNRCRVTTIDALITEALSQLELEATREYVRAATVARACNGDLTAAYALLGYWVDR